LLKDTTYNIMDVNVITEKH